MNTNDEMIFCIRGAVAAATWRTRKLSRVATFPCSILCHRFETRSFPISLVYSCAFVVTTNLASGSSSDSGRTDQRNHLAFVPAVNAKILVDCDHAVVWIKLAHPDQTKIRQIGLSIRVALG